MSAVYLLFQLICTFLFTIVSCVFTLLSLQDNYTALHLAVEAGKPAVVETLLGHGATVHIKGQYRVLIPPMLALLAPATQSLL